jgi:hypothetical protein
VSYMEGELERHLTNTCRYEEEIRASGETVKRLEMDLKNTRQALNGSIEDGQRLRAEGDQGRVEVERHRGDLERVQCECGELMDRLAREQEHNESLRLQLQSHEAAERRRCSYKPRRLASSPMGRTVLCAGGSASVGTLPSVDELEHSSPRTPSEASSGNYPSGRTGRSGSGVRTPLSQHSSIGPDSSPLMDKEERIAFLSHFPMASRTERVIQNRLEEQRRQTYIRDGSAPASPVLSARGGIMARGIATVKSQPH